MTRVSLSEHARWDMARLADFLMETDPVAAEVTADLIRDALGVLEKHPRMGRRVSTHRRELVIQRGGTGYLALYRVDDADREVEVLAIRHQRESGYHQEDL